MQTVKHGGRQSDGVGLHLLKRCGALQEGIWAS